MAKQNCSFCSAVQQKLHQEKQEREGRLVNNFFTLYSRLFLSYLSEVRFELGTTKVKLSANGSSYVCIAKYLASACRQPIYLVEQLQGVEN